MENLEQQQNAGKEAKKIEAKYAKSVDMLTAVVRGKENLSPIRLKANDLSDVIDELFKEEKEAIHKQFKVDVMVLLKQNLDFERSIKEETAKFNKIILDKKKVFGEAAMKVFSKVQGIETLQAEYARSLGAVITSGAAAEADAAGSEDDEIVDNAS